MSEQIQEIIGKAEARWLKTLYGHCRELFSTVFLPSHDHLHHYRVWSNARSLLLRLNDSEKTVPDSLPEELLIAAFFHDTGLVRTSGEQHGRESRRLCEEFFHAAGTGLSTPGDESFQNILHAIEHHDDKTLKPASPEFPPLPDLLSLLSASDDLDAFGIMGIYRYAEIYLMRGIEPEQLPLRVTENVQDRFTNLRNTFGYMEDFMHVQGKRFRQVCHFYLKLAQAYASRNERPSWEPVLIELIRGSLANKENLLKTDRILPPVEFEAEIGEWFGALDRENPTPV